MPGKKTGISHLTERLAENLLREPFEFLSADHYRHRLFCDALDALAAQFTDPVDRPIAVLITSYLEEDFEQHLDDRADSLFPLLYRMPYLEDEVAAVLRVLSAEIETDRLLSLGLKECLQEFALTGQIGNRGRFEKLVAAYTEAQRRHMTLETRIILPAAKRLLTDSEIQRFGREMAARRSIEYPNL